MKALNLFSHVLCLCLAFAVCASAFAAEEEDIFRGEMERVLRHNFKRRSLFLIRGANASAEDVETAPSSEEIERVIKALANAIETKTYAMDTEEGRVNRAFRDHEELKNPFESRLGETELMDADTQLILKTRLAFYLSKLPPSFGWRDDLAARLIEGGHMGLSLNLRALTPGEFASFMDFYGRMTQKKHPRTFKQNIRRFIRICGEILGS